MPPPLLRTVCVGTAWETTTGVTLADGLKVGNASVFVLTTRMMTLAVSPGSSATVALEMVGLVIVGLLIVGSVGFSKTGLTILVTI